MKKTTSEKVASEKKSFFLLLLILSITFPICMVGVFFIWSSFSNPAIPPEENGNVDSIKTHTYSIKELPGFNFQYPSDWELTENINYTQDGIKNMFNLNLSKIDTDLRLIISMDFLGGFETEEFCYAGKEYQVEKLNESFIRYKKEDDSWYYALGNTITDTEEKKTLARIYNFDSYENCFWIGNGFFTESTIAVSGNPPTGAIGFLANNMKLQNEDLMDEVDAIIKSIEINPIDEDNETEGNLITFTHDDLPGFSLTYSDSWAVNTKEFKTVDPNYFNDTRFIPQHESSFEDSGELMGVRFTKNDVTFQLIFEITSEDCGTFCYTNPKYETTDTNWNRVENSYGYFYSTNIKTDEQGADGMC